MKLEARSFNPLQAILQAIPDQVPQLATVEQIQTIVGLFALGGVYCESHADTIKCLELLQELNLLSVDVFNSENKTYIKLGNQYNGQ